MADNKALIRRYFEEVLSKGDIKVVDEVLAADVLVQTPSYMAEPLRGREAVKQWFSDLQGLPRPSIHPGRRGSRRGQGRQQLQAHRHPPPGLHGLAGNWQENLPHRR